MIIAFDLDGTIDDVVPMWREIIAVMREHGNQCILATCRSPEDKNIVQGFLSCMGLDFAPGQTYYSSRQSKAEYLAKLGVKVDIWIDDDPGCIVHGK